MTDTTTHVTTDEASTRERRSQAATMKAIDQDRYGAPGDVLELRDIDKPVAGDDDVLVKVRAAALDPGAWHLVTGLPYVFRLMGVGLRKPSKRVRSNVAGRVEAVGRNVTRFEVGDEVYGTCDGGFAEYACGRHDKFRRKPANLGFEQAAALDTSAVTALQALRKTGGVQPGQRVLVIGAGGGIGTYAVQLAKAFGAHVTGVCSTTKVELVRSIGADDVIDRTHEDYTDGTRRYDLILDTAAYMSGSSTLAQLRRALTPAGTLQLVGGGESRRWIGGMDRNIGARLRMALSRQRVRGLLALERKEDRPALEELVAAGKVTPVIDRTFPLSDVPQAFQHLEAGRARGKVVVTP